MRKKTGNKEAAILNAAVKIFAEYGYHQAKISKIAELSGVAIGSVYLYFKSKEDLLTTIFEKTWKELYNEFKEVVARKELDPIQKFDIMLDMIFTLFEKNPSLALVVANDEDQIIRNIRQQLSSYYIKFLDLGESLIKEGIRKKMISSDFNVKVLRFLVFGSIRYLIRGWVEQKNKLSMNEIRKSYKMIVKDGILLK